MYIRFLFRMSVLAFMLTGLVLTACTAPAVTPAPAAAPALASTPKPDWFDLPLTDVRTGQTFKINDSAGKVVLIETIAEWCPSCIFQQAETRSARKLLGSPPDLVLISLDVDLHEDAASLKQYTEDFGFDWQFAVAPLEVARALGNLYSAEYLNPPLDPMLLIDRQGKVTPLPYGPKSADALKNTVAPYLQP
jgi:cytochrome oxidase Cu insertion factor (SCO1/SenC/PrrC family)